LTLPQREAPSFRAMESLDTSSLMPIGRFSRLTGLTVKALRHYDELGLLRPAAVDPETGYRSYSTDQVGRAEWIRTLRLLELPLDDIATILATDDATTLKRLLVDQQRRTRVRQAELGWILQRLQPLIDGKEPVMGTKAETLEPEEERRLGAELFNKTWTMMEKPERTAEENDEMIHCAHASAYHWIQVGTAANRSRSEWQCSRVHAILGQVEQALWHARRCLEIVQEDPEAMKDWDLPAAYEAMARAHMVAGDREETRRYYDLGTAATALIEDEDDRRIIEADFATILI
jgi:DNA-binding transcriptional MerR regulator